MTAATFTGTGRGKAGPEEQYMDALEVGTEDDLPLVLEDAEKQPKEGKPGASKSKGKQLAQAAEGAEAPTEETPPDPKSTKPHTDPAPADPQPGTSKAPTGDPTQAPTDNPTQPAAKNPDDVSVTRSNKPCSLTNRTDIRASVVHQIDSVVNP